MFGVVMQKLEFNAADGKLDSQSVSGYFIGYCEKSKGFKFYCPKRNTRIVESHRATFYDEIFDKNAGDDVVVDMETSPEENIEAWFVYKDCSDLAAPDRNSIRNSSMELNITPSVQQATSMETQENEAENDHNEIQVDNGVQVPNEQQPNDNAVVVEEQQPVVLRKSTRVRKSAIPDDYHVYLTEEDTDIGDADDPITVAEAMKSVNCQKWRAAMEDELLSMSKNGVWTLVDKPNGFKPIGCKWVFKTKRDAEGKIERYKARLVAKGYNQKEGIDYTETFSPVSTKDALRIIMALVAYLDLELHQMDVKTAFLNGDLSEEIYMLQPDGFVEDEGKVCKLQKSIYGLKQASRQWYLKFDKVITQFGFQENKLDECIYLKTSGSNFILLILYVDDILLASSNICLLKETKAFLLSQFDMKDMGEAHYVLGIEITRNRKQQALGLSQKNYLDKILQRFGMQGCNSGDAPISKGDRLHTGQCPKSALETKSMQNVPYARLVGSLMYAQICTRPDISFAVNLLSRFQSNAGHAHWVAGKKVLRYLKKTKNYMLTYRRLEDQDFEVKGYTDASYKSDMDDLKSTTSYIFMLGGGAISWKTEKQTLTATSTFQAEYIAIHSGTGRALWLRNFISHLKLINTIERPMVIYCDNASAVFFSKNNKRSSGSMNIDVKYFSVRESVRDGEIDVVKIGTKDQLADPLTKALPVSDFVKHAANMGMADSI